MALTLWQRIRLGFSGWIRRRDQEGERRKQEFLDRNSWSPPPVGAAPAAAATATAGRTRLDMDGLQVAWLDRSGRIEYYLDLDSGEIIELDPASSAAVRADGARYRRVPGRSPDSDAAARAAFTGQVENSAVRRQLETALLSAEPEGEFRKVIATSREVERAWFRYRNDEATREAAAWAAAQ